jgi:ATP-dependent helicase HrpB
LEADLSSLVLELAQWGSADVASLDWITPPPQGAVAQAVSLLRDLGALEDLKLTRLGKEMLSLPTHPRIAHMLLKADSNEQRAIACDLAALLEERDPLGSEAGADITLRLESVRRRRAGMSAEGDRIVLDRIEKLSASWRKRLNVKATETPNIGSVGSLVASAYVERIARQEARHSERYKLANGRVALLPKNDSLVTEQWLAVAQLDGGSSEGKIFMAAAVDPKDLTDLITSHQTVRWDEEREMIVAAEEKRIGSLLVSSSRISDINDEQRIDVLCKTVRANGMSFLGWDEKERDWQARVMSLRAWRGNKWPDVSDEVLLGTLEKWLAPFLAGVTRKSDLMKLDWSAVLTNILPWELQSKLNKLAPERIEVPTGSMIKVSYSLHAEEPAMEVRLQELFGLLETPTVNDGKMKIVMHLLSPGYKPVQVTRDLRSFWTNTYHEIRKEFRVRYPRHSWPDDPFTAQAVRGAKRRAG